MGCGFGLPLFILPFIYFIELFLWWRKDSQLKIQNKKSEETERKLSASVIPEWTSQTLAKTATRKGEKLKFPMTLLTVSSLFSRWWWKDQFFLQMKQRSDKRYEPLTGVRIETCFYVLRRRWSRLRPPLLRVFSKLRELRGRKDWKTPLQLYACEAVKLST